MSEETEALRRKLIALMKGATVLEQDRERAMQLLRGVVSTGSDLLVELRVEETLEKRHVNR